jgi:glutamate-1-semialdehyde aminotransferase
MRFGEPSNGFLHRVREIADRTGAVLIFDEITAGWRHCYGGLHLKLGVNPDIAVFAKSLSNGFPMAAIVGTIAAMQAAQQSFISSTFWTESIGPAAALATLKKMKSIDVSAKASKAGAIAQNAWRELARKHELDIAISGWPALTTFALNYGEQSGALKTLLTQEMLDRGFLANTTFYPTAAHDQSVMNQYIVALDEVFGELRQAIVEGDVLARLRGGPAHGGFARLT